MEKFLCTHGPAQPAGHKCEMHKGAEKEACAPIWLWSGRWDQHHWDISLSGKPVCLRKEPEMPWSALGTVPAYIRSISSYGAISVSSSGSRMWLEQNQDVRQKYSDTILICLKSPTSSCGTAREPRSWPSMQQSHIGLRVALDVHSNTSSLYSYVTQTVSGDLWLYYVGWWSHSSLHIYFSFFCFLWHTTNKAFQYCWGVTKTMST